MAVVTVLSLAGLVAGCKREGGTAAGAPAQQPPPNVVVSAAESKDVPVYIDAIGKSMAIESVMITPRVAGQIVERRFEDGADVKKDQVLFLIDPAPAQAALAAAQAQLASSQAASKLAAIELERYTAVAGTNAISKSDFDTKKNAVDVANAQVAAGEAAVKQAQINLDFCTIKSPIDGRAGARLVDVGNVVKENDAQLLSIQSVTPIYADFTINEQSLGRVREEMKNGNLQTLVRIANDESGDRKGDLIFLDNAVDGTGTVRLRAKLDNADRKFWPGQFVQVRLVLRTLKDAVLVPASAQQIGQGGPFVLIVKGDGTAEQRDITPGQQQGDHIVVEKGVAAGEQVIVEGQLMVRPGGPVKVATTGAPVAAGTIEAKDPRSSDAPASQPAAAEGTAGAPANAGSTAAPGASVNQATATGAAQHSAGGGPAPAPMMQNQQSPGGSSTR